MKNKPTINKQEAPKKELVENMFNNIAPSYDFLNHFLSIGIDRIWRKKVIAQFAESNKNKMLDVATGTGDLAIAAATKHKNLVINGIDIADAMLEIAKTKINKKKLTNRISLHNEDAENLSFSDNSFDYATSSFGVRNFENVQKGLNEMFRVLKPDGKIVILEFSKPQKGIFAFIFRIYFKHILPMFGKIVSGNNKAYKYLPNSVSTFAERDDFIKLLQVAGFSQCNYTPFTFGVACMYIGKKVDNK